MFKDEASSLVAIELETELKETVREEIRLAREKHGGVELVSQALENRAAAIIRKILMDINPEVLGNVQNIDERIILAVYRQMQSNSASAKMDFFKLLIELNKNPLFAIVFA